MNAYKELKDRQQEEINAFPIGVAFSNEQFAKMMQEWGLMVKDIDKICSLGGGCFIRKSDEDAFLEMTSRHTKEMKDAIDADETGDGFIYNMFAYELGNHEFDITWDLSETIYACGLSMVAVFEKLNIEKGLRKALKKYRACWLLDNAKECYKNRQSERRGS